MVQFCASVSPKIHIQGSAGWKCTIAMAFVGRWGIFGCVQRGGQSQRYRIQAGAQSTTGSKQRVFGAIPRSCRGFDRTVRLWLCARPQSSPSDSRDATSIHSSSRSVSGTSKPNVNINPCGAKASATHSPPPVTWTNWANWKKAGVNTSWCLLGCSIGEFGTLAAYDLFGLEQTSGIGAEWYYLWLGLPLINGLATSVALETALLTRGPSGLKMRPAFETAVGMSFISMLMMEIAMEATDLWFTEGALTVAPAAMPLMLAAGWLTPLPYNYYRMQKFGKSCH